MMTIKLIVFLRNSFERKFERNQPNLPPFSTSSLPFLRHFPIIFFLDFLIFKQTCNSSIWSLSEEAHSRILYKIGSISLEVIR